MAHPARAIDPFTLKKIRASEDKVFMLCTHLRIECDKLREMTAPFRLAVDDDYDELGIELVEKWLRLIQAALPSRRDGTLTGY